MFEIFDVVSKSLPVKPTSAPPHFLLCRDYTFLFLSFIFLSLLLLFKTGYLGNIL